MNRGSLELYSAAQTRELDRRAIEALGIPGHALMQRAAAAAWTALKDRWPDARRIAVFCGSGNNGGDGYELACLAQAEHRALQVFRIGRTPNAGDAAIAHARWTAVGTVQGWQDGALERPDVIVDAIFGTGLSRAPDGEAGAAIAAINAARAAGAGVLAIDIPSGVMADTGVVAGYAVDADLTVTFIARKPGLFTGQGPAQSGDVLFEDLGLPASLAEGLQPVAGLLQQAQLRRWLPPRRRDAHKGGNGHVLVIGGNTGMAGAVLMAGRAALRAGAGLVTVATRAEHAVALAAAQPELMVQPIEHGDALAALLARAQVIAIGPGLGQDAWARQLFASALAARKTMVVDADALNLLAAAPQASADWVLTPHPGEAARLLGQTTADIARDRAAAAAGLRQRYGGVAVLKGAGSLVQGDQQWICPYGNPGMATGGMGDALTGVIAAFLAQGLALETAAAAGVMAHALAGDRAAQRHGERGLAAGDLIDELRAVVNP